jgi:glucosamine--fructose-6-phosphate aminotransferase (isomerizing)
MAKYWFEELTSLDVNVDIASEFRYRKNRFKKDTLYVLFLNLVKQLILMQH